MAARSSTGIGIGISLALACVAAVALFITTIIFFTKMQASQRELAEEREQTREFVAPAERQMDTVNRVKQAADRERKSVVGYLMDTQSESMDIVLGSRTGTIDDLRRAAERNGVSASSSMVARLKSLQGDIDRLGDQLSTAEDNERRALQDKQAEIDRVGRLQAEQQNTIDALNGELERYQAEVDRYREEINSYKADLTRRGDRIQAEARNREAELQADIDKLERDLLLANDTVQRLQKELRGTLYSGQAEEALVDARVIGIDPIDNNVFMNVGRRQRARIGMRFELYAEPTAIRADDAGAYPLGKATVEIIELDADTATCRILRDTRGNPVVKGDVAANAVYDPNKIYTFLVYGNFDADGDGRPSEREQFDIRARIEEWGGRTVDELTGSVDFLVLGQKPALPPEPPLDAPPAIIEEYIRLDRLANKYDQLFEQATATSIPVLNENRLNTLTGYTIR